MITRIKYPDKNSFIGNPMFVEITGDSSEEVILSLSINGMKVIDLSIFLFDNTSTYFGKINVANFFASFFKKINNSTGAIIGPVDNFMLDYSINILNYEGDNYTFEGKAFYGGITDSNYSRLKDSDSNIFDYRLQNYERQFLFTTRTYGNTIVLRETELNPFIFIHPGKAISIVTSAGRIIIPKTEPEGSVCFLNIEEARKAFFHTYKELPSFFSIRVDDNPIFEIALIANQISEERYILRFRNSIGAYEKIEVVGSAEMQTTFLEEDSWMSYHDDDYYFEKRSRVKSREKFIVQSGYKSRDELRFMLDMIKSDEIYLSDLSDPDAPERKCLVTPDEFSIPYKITEPQFVDLKIRFTSDEAFSSPDLKFETAKQLFQNITTLTNSDINGSGLIFGDEIALHGDASLPGIHNITSPESPQISGSGIVIGDAIALYEF